MGTSCEHRQCEKEGKKLCAEGHEDCVWYGCNDKLHTMAGGPGGYIPWADDYNPRGMT